MPTSNLRTVVPASGGKVRISDRVRIPDGHDASCSRSKRKKRVAHLWQCASTVVQEIGPIDLALVLSEHEDATLLSRALELSPRARIAELAARLEEIGGLHGLYEGGSESLEGLLDHAEAIRLEAILELTGRLLAPAALPERVEDVLEVASFFQPRLAMEKSESFWALFLDARLRPSSARCIARGTLTSCMVHPREVFAPAIRARAASLIVIHNHPSGDPAPSDEDKQLTERLSEAGRVLGIPLVDHVIVAREGVCSLGHPQDARRSQPSRHGAHPRGGRRTWKT
jgi:DNA repair protein RadC